jgi:hypothetical protein
MAVRIVNSPGQAGYVHLVFDRHIDVDLLRLAFSNRMARTYLGRFSWQSELVPRTLALLRPDVVQAQT